MQYLGDIALSQILYFGWHSNAVAGGSITRATNGTISVYKDDGLTQSTTGVTDTEDFDGLTGVHWVKIDTSADGTFYAAGHDFAVVLSAATIDGQTINAVLAHFSINNRSALRPTTAGRTLVVDAAGLADANAVKVGPSGSGTAQTARDLGTSVLLSSGTGTGQLDFASGVVKANLAQILGTALTETAGQIAAAFKQFFDVASPTGTMKAITNVVTATNLTNAPTNGDLTTAMKASVNAEVDTALADYDGPTHAELVSEIDSVQSDIAALNDLDATAVENAVWDAVLADHLDAGSTGEALSDAGGVGTPPTVAEIADGVWDEARAGHTTVGSFGQGVASVQGNVTGSVGSVTGNVGGNVAGSIGSLATQAKADVNAEADTALADYDGPTHAELTSEIDSVQTDIAALNDLDAAGIRSAVGLASANLDTQLTTIDDYLDTEIAAILAAVDTEIAAIKNKTDTIPASPAAVGSAMTLAADAVNASALAANAVAEIKAALDTTAMTESYAALGAAPTKEQALFMILQHLLEREFTVVGPAGLLTTKKLDGSTTAMTFDLDSATAPTSQTRAS